MAAPVFALFGLPVNLQGLSIEGVRVTLRDVAGKRVLMVEGAIANLGTGEMLSPDLQIALRDTSGGQLYVWRARAPQNLIAGEDRVSFSARLAAPPDGVKDAVVKFVATGDSDRRSTEGS